MTSDIRNPKSRIMVVEDESITALSIKESLGDLGYSVTSICSTGEEAVKNARADRPDLILMDITLQGEMDGTEAARKIRSYLKIPVVYLTAHSDEKMFQQARITEPFGYIIKPFDNRELNIAIEIALYRNKMESALRESRMRYSTLFRTAADAICLIDAGTQKIVECNPKAAEITGYSARQLKTMTVSELHPLEEQDVVAAVFSKLDKMGALSGISGVNQKRQDGQLVPVEINASRIRLGGAKYFLGVFRDITDRKKAEEALRSERNKLVNILNAMKDGVYIVNQDYKIEYINPSFRKEFRTAKGHACHEYFHGEENICPICKNTDAFAGSTIQWEWTSPVSGKSYDIIETPLTNSDGSISKLSIFRDITDRKKMETQLQESAFLDILTGLFNRRGFFAHAEQRTRLALRTGENLTLLYLDLDGLKAINDRLGHQAGDSALIGAAEVIRKTFRESDIIARIGGDEFAALLTTPSEGSIEKVIANHLQKGLKAFNAQGKRDYTLSLSEGMAHWSPERPCSIDELLCRADAMMYENKKRHKLHPSAEKRRHERFRTADECRAVYNGSGPVAIKDISSGGICLEMTEQPAAASVFRVRILKNDDEIIAATGRVVWHTSAGAETGKYLAGLKFLNIRDRIKNSLKQMIYRK